VFGPHLEQAERYAALLADAGVIRGLIGPREVPRIWDRHLVNSALIAEGVDHGDTVCDVGSGAGLPGLVLAVVRPDLRVTLLEPLLRRVTFLEETVGALGLGNVEVLRGRAEDLRDRRFDVVTARAVAPLDRLARWTLPLVRPGGRLLAMKGASAAEEMAEHASALRSAGAQNWRIREFCAAGASTLAIEVVGGDTETRSSPEPSSRGRRRGAQRPRRGGQQHRSD